MPHHPRLLLPALALLAAVPVTAAATPPHVGPATAEAPAVSVAWRDAPVEPARVAVGNTLVAQVAVDSVPDAGVLRVSARGGRFTALPRGCVPSSIVRRRSSISADGTRLRCLVRRGPRVLRAPLEVTAGPGRAVGVVATLGRAQAAAPRLTSLGGRSAAPAYRFLSSPDFLNGDVADLRRGPGAWDPRRSPNSINAAYRSALDHVLGAFADEAPGSVLVAGDLVEGWWGTDPGRTGTFGPVGTPAERRAALRRAADTYYPQWLQRFRSRGLAVLPAMGDHELGDDPWTSRKRALAPAFERAWSRWFGRRADGSPRFADRPRGSRHELSAYAVRPTPELQVVTINVFDVTPDRARVQVDPAQLAWLRDVLRRARRDGVAWVVVQGHAPVLRTDRARGSSGLHVRGGPGSALWRTFARFGVDLYLCGEVHDVSVAERDGVVQVTHGGIFQFGLTNYLRADVRPDRVELELRDFAARWADAADGSRLWETRPAGMPAVVRVRRTPFTIGMMTLGLDGVQQASGVLRPRR